jgi:hypothetical protein
MNFASILSVTHSVIAKGGDDNTAVLSAYSTLKQGKQTLASLLALEREHAGVKRGVETAYRSLVGSMRNVLQSNALDVTSTSAVRDAIRFNVWLDEGYKVALVNSKATPLAKAELDTYNRVSQRLSRLARDIVGETKPTPEVVPVVIPRALRASMKASTLDAGVDFKVALAALKSIYGK